MKIGFISDLHFDHAIYYLNRQGIAITLDELIAYTLNEFATRELDYCIISGDISNRIESTREIVGKLNSGNTKVYYTLGNHDMWIHQSHVEKELFRIQEDDVCLLNKVVCLGDEFVLIGMFSWYDSSLETLGHDQSYYELRKILWVDHQYVRWDNKTNEQIVYNQLSKTRKLLREVPEDKKIILVNHFVPHKNFIIHKQNNDDWNFGSAFMGSELIEQLAQSDDRIKYVTFGHTHYHYDSVEKNGVHYLSYPLGYVHEWTSKNFADQLKHSLGVLKL